AVEAVGAVADYVDELRHAAIGRLWPIGPRAGSERPGDAAGGGDAVSGHAREGREPMRLRLAAARDVHDLDAAGDEGVGDELAVAAPGHGLGAHDRRAMTFGEREEAFESLPELVAVH